MLWDPHLSLAGMLLGLKLTLCESRHPPHPRTGNVFYRPKEAVT